MLKQSNDAARLAVYLPNALQGVIWKPNETLTGDVEISATEEDVYDLEFQAVITLNGERIASPVTIFDFMLSNGDKSMFGVSSTTTIGGRVLDPTEYSKMRNLTGKDIEDFKSKTIDPARENYLKQRIPGSFWPWVSSGNFPHENVDEVIIFDGGSL